MIFRCPNIQTDYNEAVLCLNFGTPENNEFSIWDKWKMQGYYWPKILMGPYIGSKAHLPFIHMQKSKF